MSPKVDRMRSIFKCSLGTLTSILFVIQTEICFISTDEYVLFPSYRRLMTFENSQ